MLMTHRSPITPEIQNVLDSLHVLDPGRYGVIPAPNGKMCVTVLVNGLGIVIINRPMGKRRTLKLLGALV